MSNCVEITAVTKSFGRRKRPWHLFGQAEGDRVEALRGVSLSTGKGQVLAILGPNGSGKTTLLKLVSTMLLPDSGSVRVLDADTRSASRSVRRNVGIAVAAERSFFPRLTARENLEFFAALDEVPRGERASRVSSLLDTVHLTGSSQMLAMKFSSGMFQRLGIARALLKDPSVLLLDEPTRSLDPEATRGIWELVRSMKHGGTTILLATHSFEEAFAVADQVALLRRGEVAALRPMSAFSEAAQLRDYYFSQVGTEAAEQPGGVEP